MALRNPPNEIAAMFRAEKVVPLQGSWERLKASRAYKHAEKEAEYAALCVVGTFDRQPRSRGDNHGVHPSRLVVTIGDPARAIDPFNRGVHSVGAIYHTQVYVYWQSRKHAEDARTWIEGQVKPAALLHGWSDVEPWQWEIMFNEAASALGFEAFDETEKARRVWARAKRG